MIREALDATTPAVARCLLLLLLAVAPAARADTAPVPSFKASSYPDDKRLPPVSICEPTSNPAAYPLGTVVRVQAEFWSNLEFSVLAEPRCREAGGLQPMFPESLPPADLARLENIFRATAATAMTPGISKVSVDVTGVLVTPTWPASRALAVRRLLRYQPLP